MAIQNELPSGSEYTSTLDIMFRKPCESLGLREEQDTLYIIVSDGVHTILRALDMLMY